VRRVIEASQERAVVGGEDLGFSHAVLGAHECECLANRAREEGGAGHYDRRPGVAAVGYPFSRQPGMPSSRITMFR
jgi:hypothetical protein